MQLHLTLAPVEPTVFTLPAMCPSSGCVGREFRPHQQVRKPLNDAMHRTVMVYRYRCTCCGRTFRVYPKGVTRAHTSRIVQDVAVVLYLLGLSFGAVSAALEILGVYLSKSRVYDTVQTAMRRQPLLTRSNVFTAIQRRSGQEAALHVQCMGQWLPLTLTTDAYSSLILTVTSLSLGDLAVLHAATNPLMAALGGRVVVVDAHASQDDAVPPQGWSA